MTYSNLTTGSRGEDVRKLQETLMNAGYDVGSTGADGVYGAKTQAAVRQYQQDHGLSVDGIAGEKTQTSLYSGTNSTGSEAQNIQTNSPVPTPAAAYNPGTDAAYQQAIAALTAVNQNAPTYTPSYDAQLQELYKQIVGRPKFQYDINDDMLYRQYAQQYADQGRIAMEDTVGQAAALTGGYDSSYAQSVGQQQYDAYLKRLGEVIPELYDMARDQYDTEGDALLQQYAMLGEIADDEYGRYQDAYSRWANERDAAIDQMNADREYQLAKDKWDYSVQQDEEAKAAKNEPKYIYVDRENEEPVVLGAPGAKVNSGMVASEIYDYIRNAYMEGGRPEAAAMIAQMAPYLTDEQLESLMTAYGI